MNNSLIDCGIAASGWRKRSLYLIIWKVKALMNLISYVGFSFTGKVGQCEIFKIQDTSTGLEEVEDTAIYIKPGEVECLQEEQCHRPEPQSLPQCIKMKCQFCNQHYLLVRSPWNDWPRWQNLIIPGQRGKIWTVQVQQEILRQQKSQVSIQTPTSRLVECQTDQGQVSSPGNLDVKLINTYFVCQDIPF